MRTHSNQPCAETLGGSGQECAPCTIRGVEASVDGVRESRPNLGLAPRSSHHGHKARVRREACKVENADQVETGGACIVASGSALRIYCKHRTQGTHTCWLLVWHKLAPKPAVFDHPVGVPVACIMDSKRRETHRDPAPGGAKEVLAHSPVVPWWPFTSTERS